MHSKRFAHLLFLCFAALGGCQRPEAPAIVQESARAKSEAAAATSPTPTRNSPPSPAADHNKPAEETNQTATVAIAPLPPTSTATAGSDASGVACAPLYETPEAAMTFLGSRLLQFTVLADAPKRFAGFCFELVQDPTDDSGMTLSGKHATGVWTSLEIRFAKNSNDIAFFSGLDLIAPAGTDHSTLANGLFKAGNKLFGKAKWHRESDKKIKSAEWNVPMTDLSLTIGPEDDGKYVLVLQAADIAE